MNNDNKNKSAKKRVRLVEQVENIAKDAAVAREMAEVHDDAIGDVSAELQELRAENLRLRKDIERLFGIVKDIKSEVFRDNEILVLDSDD